MPYVEGRIVHDADSHIMELPDSFDPYLETRYLQRFHELPDVRARRSYLEHMDKARALQADADFRAAVDDTVMLRKNHEAHGSFLAEDRPRALDLLGFASQLVFTTFGLSNFGLDQTSDHEFCYAVADAQNRMMTDFCATDRRLLAAAYIPIEDFDQAIACATRAIDMGAKALMIPSRPAKTHAHSHVGLDPLWATAQEAGLPVLFHVGGQEKMDPVYLENGLPPVPDFHGGDDNFTSVSYMPIPTSVMQTVAVMIFDGVFDRFPNLKFGAIELGASWMPGWMRSMDSAAHAFTRNEERLQNLSAKPSEIVRRQFRAAPYPHEDAGWIIRNAGEEVAMFSSDYPHVEGGRNPLKRFNECLEGLSDEAVDGFFAANFIDMMGEGLAEDLRRPAHLLAA
ncbi:MAG: amidohydrolase family protein [Pseudomonadota bacterium]